MKLTDLTKYLRGLRGGAACVVDDQIAGFVRVTCGKCETLISNTTDDLTVGTLVDIERALEPCLGKRWMPE